MAELGREVKVAGIQMSCVIGNKEKNVKKALNLIEKAARDGCKIVSLVELFNTEYVCFTKRDPKNFDYAEPIPGPTTDKISEKAREYGIYIIAPIFEEAGPRLYYNTAPLIGPTGEIVGIYRKTHIPAPVAAWMGMEKLYFRPGSEFPVFKTEFGKLGIVICYDRYFPETWRILAFKGAEIIFNPACMSVKSRGRKYTAPELWEMFSAVRAFENGVFVVAINRVGKEEGRQHFGTSLIASPSGEILNKAGESEETVVSATLNLEEVHRGASFFRDVRPEIYGRLTQSPTY